MSSLEEAKAIVEGKTLASKDEADGKKAAEKVEEEAPFVQEFYFNKGL